MLSLLVEKTYYEEEEDSNDKVECVYAGGTS